MKLFSYSFSSSELELECIAKSSSFVDNNVNKKQFEYNLID